MRSPRDCASKDTAHSDCMASLMLSGGIDVVGRWCNDGLLH